MDLPQSLGLLMGKGQRVRDREKVNENQTEGNQKKERLKVGIATLEAHAAFGWMEK